MNKLLKSLLLCFFAVLIASGSGMALTVQGTVNSSSATFIDNNDGTTNVIGLNYIFSVVDLDDNYGLRSLQLDFSKDIFVGIINDPYDYHPTSWQL